MSVAIAAYKETKAHEKRVAIVPQIAEKYQALGLEVLLERGSGLASTFPDDSFAQAKFFDTKSALREAKILLAVQPPELDEVDALESGTILVGMLQPTANTALIKKLCEKNITSFSLELMPRISRAQSMDVLSSQATVAGYKAVLIAANSSTGFFPMLTTAAGTIKPARVLVLGAGVAGLQAIATAKRLGAIVEAYDVRATTKEQVESLGAKFISLDIDAQTETGYARALTEEEQQQADELVARHVAQADVVITTAAIPGKPAPKLISASVVNTMKPGSIIVDLAAETGGNCELTQAGQEVQHKNTLIIGPENLASRLPAHASEMLAKNIFNFVSTWIKDGKIELDWEDELVKDCALTHEGQAVSPIAKQLLEGANP